jgi:hypothetical protein
MGGQMTGGGMTAIRVAAVQAQSLPGQIQANFDHAAGLVEQAAAQGASMVVLPELFSCGYVPNRAVWETAEARGGQTDRWLAATARRLGIYLGVGAAESDGTDFFNVFTLAAPAGADRDRDRDLRRQPVRRHHGDYARAAGRSDPHAARVADPGPRRRAGQPGRRRRAAAAADD